MLVLLSRKLFGLLHAILATFRKILCLFKRREKEPDVLPFIVTADRSSSYRSENFTGGQSDVSTRPWHLLII